MHRPPIQPEIPTAIFSGLTDVETQHLLACMLATERSFKRGEVPVSQGEKTTSIGIVLKGTLLLADEGNYPSTPVVVVNARDHFGQDLRLQEDDEVSRTVTVASARSIAALDLRSLQNADGHHFELRDRLAAKLQELAAENSARATAHRQLLEHESLRDRLSSDFKQQRTEQATEMLFIALTRDQLAAHLGGSKPELANELKAMKEDELIDFYRNSFRFLQPLMISGKERQ